MSPRKNFKTFLLSWVFQYPQEIINGITKICSKGIPIAFSRKINLNLSRACLTCCERLFVHFSPFKWLAQMLFVLVFLTFSSTRSLVRLMRRFANQWQIASRIESCSIPLWRLKTLTLCNNQNILATRAEEVSHDIRLRHEILALEILNSRPWIKRLVLQRAMNKFNG